MILLLFTESCKWGLVEVESLLMGAMCGILDFESDRNSFALPMGRNKDASQRAGGTSHMIMVTITSVTSFPGQRCLTQLWVYILAGGPFGVTFISTSYKAETHITWWK